MKALVVRQPYAEWIAAGKKTLEIRSWRTHYRGPLIICAAARPMDGRGKDMPLGAAICVVELVDVAPWRRHDAKKACAPWQRDLLAWHLSKPRRFDPVPLKGQLGLFTPPPAVLLAAADI